MKNWSVQCGVVFSMPLLHSSSKVLRFKSSAWHDEISEFLCYYFWNGLGLVRFLNCHDLEHCSKNSNIRARESRKVTYWMWNAVSLMMNNTWAFLNIPHSYESVLCCISVVIRGNLTKRLPALHGIKLTLCRINQEIAWALLLCPCLTLRVVRARRTYHPVGCWETWLHGHALQPNR